MMLLTIKEEHQEHLKFLANQPIQVLQDFCQLASIYVESGPNLKTYSNASQKLNVNPDDIKQAVEGILFLSLESSRFKTSEEELSIALIGLGFSPEQQEIIRNWISSQQNNLELIEYMKPKSLHYSSLIWRLEARMASRCCLNQQGNVSITILLNLNNNKYILNATPSMIKYLVNEFEKAIKESSCRHVRKALRAIK